MPELWEQSIHYTKTSLIVCPIVTIFDMAEQWRRNVCLFHCAAPLALNSIACINRQILDFETVSEALDPLVQFCHSAKNAALGVTPAFMGFLRISNILQKSIISLQFSNLRA
jgi:hypothetical protein